MGLANINKKRTWIFHVRLSRGSPCVTIPITENREFVERIDLSHSLAGNLDTQSVKILVNFIGFRVNPWVMKNVYQRRIVSLFVNQNLILLLTL